MSTTPDDPALGQARLARGPCGVLGLIVSLVAIVIAMAAILVLAGAAAFLVVVAFQGLPATLDIASALASPGNFGSQASRRFLIVATLFQDAALFAAILGAAAIRGRSRWRDLVGWHPFNLRGTIKLILGLLVVAMIYNVAASSLVERYVPQAKDWTPTPSGASWIVVFAILATLFAPLTEELLFRGWIYTSLRRSFGVIVGILVSSLLFAVAHWDRTHLYALTIFPVGCVLCYIRERTGSIGASMLFHALFNGLATLAILAAT